MKTIAICQARLGSTRLPAKVMLAINGMTLLEIFVRRLRQSKLLDDIIIATSVNSQDDIIVDECNRLGVKYFRGDELNVLSRYYYCAKENKAELIVRVTSDCPLIDPRIIDAGIKAHIENDSDFSNNHYIKTFPHGYDYQMLKFELLEESFMNAKEPEELEHVVPYIEKNIDRYNFLSFTNSITRECGEIRITVDNLNDYIEVSKIIRRVNKKVEDIELLDIIANYDEN